MSFFEELLEAVRNEDFTRSSKLYLIVRCAKKNFNHCISEEEAEKVLMFLESYETNKKNLQHRVKIRVEHEKRVCDTVQA